MDPFELRGLWLVTTESGARHLIDARDPDAPVTVVRLTAGAPPPAEGVELAQLRQDGSEIRVFAISHLTHDGPVSGVAVGFDMVLTLEPLDRLLASITVRHTTAVVAIERMDVAEVEEVLDVDQ